MRYLNRQDAGRQLAKALAHLKGNDAVVLALPRGGVVLGAEVAKELHAPLGVVLVRKIGHPYSPEYAIGAYVEGAEPVYNQKEIATIDKDWLHRAEAEAKELIDNRRRLYYGKDVIPPEIKDKIVIIVDDGIATGLTMEAAVRAVRNQQPKHIVVAVPVASFESVRKLESIANQVLVLEDPDSFLSSVGAHYQQFDQVDDREVIALLKRRLND